MADEFLRMPDDAANTGKRVDNWSLTVGGVLVYRQRVQLAGAGAAELCVVKNTTPAGADYGLVVRTVGDVPVTVATLPLPGGAATEVTLAAILTALGGAATEATLADILAELQGTIAVAGTVSVASLPALPAGSNNIGDVDVVSLPALPAGANAIGTVGVTSLPALPAGANNIGDVDVVSLPALPAGTNNIGDVDVLSQPARSRTTDAIAVAVQTDAIMLGGTALTPKFAAINRATSGDVVAAVSGKKIRVLALFAVANVDGTFRFRRGTTDLTGDMTVRQGGGVVLPFNPAGWFETNATEALDVRLTTVSQLSGALTYIEV